MMSQPSHMFRTSACVSGAKLENKTISTGRFTSSDPIEAFDRSSAQEDVFKFKNLASATMIKFSHEGRWICRDKLCLPL